MSNTDYDLIASQVNEAFQAYRNTYAQTNPPPDLQKVARKHVQSNKVMYRLLGVLVVASVVVSGSHTVPVFADSLPTGTHPIIALIVSVAAFVAIEVAILVYAYQRVEKAHADNPNMSKDVQRLMGYGLALAISVALGANVYSVLKPHMVGELTSIWQGVSIIVATLVGISAPVLAFIAGELFGLMNVEARERKNTVFNEHEQLTEAWEAGLRDAWARDRAKWGARVSVERPVSVVLPDAPVRPVLSAPDGQADKHGYGVGYVRASDAFQRVIDYLSANADAGQMTVRQLADAVGVGKTTAAAALKKWQQQQQ